MPMKTSLVAAIMLTLGSATQALAATSGQQVCPAKSQGQSSSSYVASTHAYCESQWSDASATHPTGGQSHDQFVNSCSRQCLGDVGATTAGYNIGVVGGLAIAGLIAVGVGAALDGSPPSSYSAPPASP
jgi:hypothetical protein